MRVLVLLTAVVCGVVCVHSAQLPRPLKEWPKGILDPKTATCDKAFPSFYSGDGCLAINWGGQSDKKCKYVVESCLCIPQFVKDAVSELQPSEANIDLHICVYLVHVIQLQVPGCCAKYFYPVGKQTGNSKISGAAIGGSGGKGLQTELGPKLREEYQDLIPELKKGNSKLAKSFLLRDNIFPFKERDPSCRYRFPNSPYNRYRCFGWGFGGVWGGQY